MSVLRTLLSSSALGQASRLSFPGFARSVATARPAFARQDYGNDGPAPRSFGGRPLQNVAPGGSNPMAQSSYADQLSSQSGSSSNSGEYYEQNENAYPIRNAYSGYNKAAPNRNVNANANANSAENTAAAEVSSKGAAASLSSVFNDRSIYSLITKESFKPEVEATLQEPLDENIVEIRPDGMIYVPSVHYRRVLNKAFGYGGWFLCPLSDPVIRDKFIVREYGLICQGRLVSQTMGEHSITDPSSSFASNLEACKSNALTRAAKDLGIFSELHDTTYSTQWKSSHAERVMHENTRSKEKRSFWRKIGRTLQYPWIELRGNSSNN